MSHVTCDLQWASIILVIEQTVTTEARKQQQISYSLPLSDGRRAILIKWHQTVSDTSGYVQLAMVKYQPTFETCGGIHLLHTHKFPDFRPTHPPCTHRL